MAKGDPGQGQEPINKEKNTHRESAVFRVRMASLAYLSGFVRDLVGGRVE